jgi:AcrR family transcriptional regulator
LQQFIMPTTKAERTSLKDVEPGRATEIYFKAAQIFYEKGFDATSMDDLAKALQITKAGLYYYIESKEDLLFAIMSFGLDWLDREVTQPARDIADPEQRLRWIIQRHAGKLTEGSHAVPILTDEVSALTPKHRRNILARKRTYFDLVRGTLEELKRQDRLREVDTTVATFTLFGSMLWLPRWYSPAGRLNSEEVVEHLVRLLLGGLLKSTQGQ